MLKLIYKQEVYIYSFSSCHKLFSIDSAYYKQMKMKPVMGWNIVKNKK